MPLPSAVAGAIERAGAGRHHGSRTTMRYDRGRKNLDRHPNYILAAYMGHPAPETS